MHFNIHYSFDLYNTLIRPNPAFKRERTRFFYEKLNFDAKSFEEIELTFREVDQMCKAISEKTGKTIDADEMYLMVISSINDYCYPVSKVDLDWLFQEMDALLFNHMPLLYSPKTLPVLSRLKEPGNVTMSVVSNTGFHRGSTLRAVLKSLGISDFIDFQLYSDQTRLVSSNPDVNYLLLEYINRQVKGRPVELKDIIFAQKNPVNCIGGKNCIEIDSLLSDATYQSLYHFA